MDNTLISQTSPIRGERTFGSYAFNERSSQHNYIAPARRENTEAFDTVEPLERKRNKHLKRTFDVVFSAMVLLTIFPLMYLIVGILIKLDSRGPVFFRQERSGLRNKTFGMFKFRTMTVNERSDLDQAMPGDTRVTRIGNFLRKNSLDEFPQFINVLMGDMSVVGPRPHMVAHTEYYSELIDDYMVRHEAKPGVTGWAQIKGFRGPTDELWKMEKRVEHDIWYLRNWNFVLDCKCVLRTVVNVAEGEENAL